MKKDDGSAGSSHGRHEDLIATRLAEIVEAVGMGGRLPSERKFAEELGVSRTALRDRLQQAEAFGVLRRRVGAGTYVEWLDPAGLSIAFQLALSSSQLPESSLLQVRVALERQAAIEATDIADPVLLAYIAKATNAIASATSYDDLASADMEFHDALVRSAKNPAIDFLLNALAEPLHGLVNRRLTSLLRTPGARELMTQVHRDIHVAVASGDRRRAVQAVDAHFAAFDQAVGLSTEPKH